MVNFFLQVALIMTLIFFVLMVGLFVCQWIIYFRVERTTLKQERRRK